MSRALMEARKAWSRGSRLCGAGSSGAWEGEPHLARIVPDGVCVERLPVFQQQLYRLRPGKACSKENRVSAFTRPAVTARAARTSRRPCHAAMPRRGVPRSSLLLAVPRGASPCKVGAGARHGDTLATGSPSPASPMISRWPHDSSPARVRHWNRDGRHGGKRPRTASSASSARRCSASRTSSALPSRARCTSS